MAQNQPKTEAIEREICFCPGTPAQNDVEPVCGGVQPQTRRSRPTYQVSAQASAQLGGIGTLQA